MNLSLSKRFLTGSDSDERAGHVRAAAGRASDRRDLRIFVRTDAGAPGP
jgi:hypothetical protein